jgi:hypothetical protein
MGIDFTSLEAILISLKFITKQENLLTLGRQQIHRNKQTINHHLVKYNLIKLLDRYQYFMYCEQLFEDLGFQSIDSIDYSSYEEANIIHDMNQPLPNNMKKYNYIYDGGTIEHIFNTPQVLQNIINLLEIDGIFCSVTCNNNLSGHGLYQFSPELFALAFSPNYGMCIKGMWIARNNSEVEEWIDITKYKMGDRNCTKLNTMDEVYIITIAQKIANNRLSLLTTPPYQSSYQLIEWTK